MSEKQEQVEAVPVHWDVPRNMKRQREELKGSGFGAALDVQSFVSSHPRVKIYWPRETGRDVREVVKEQVDEEAKHEQTMLERSSSPIISLRNMLNWCKAVLLRSHVQRGDVMFDLGCGKGADLSKAATAGVSKYVGVDFSKEALKDTIGRFNRLVSARGGTEWPFEVKLICADLCQTSLARQGALEHTQFDLVSMESSLQYACSDERSLRCFLRNATDRLKPGGYLIGIAPDTDAIMNRLRSTGGFMISNDIMKAQFTKSAETIDAMSSPRLGIKWTFSLGEVLHDRPEYLVDFDFVDLVLSEYGLDIEMDMNLISFYMAYRDIPRYKAMLLARGLESEDASKILSYPEWEAMSLFRCFAYRKREETTVFRNPPLKEEDIIDLINVESEEAFGESGSAATVMRANVP